MDIIIDGSYTDNSSDVISCGVIVMDSLGFYTEHRFQTNHIQASSSFAEWYGLECALNMIINHEIDTTFEKKINIYTDCQSIIDVMGRKGNSIKNELLHQYISKITMMYSEIPSYNRDNYAFHHIKQRGHERQIAKLHMRAHEQAQNEACATVEQPSDHIYLQIRLEAVSKGHRQWIVYENQKPLYTGKFRTVLDKYQRERHDINTLFAQERITVDKRTSRLLKKYIGSV